MVTHLNTHTVCMKRHFTKIKKSHTNDADVQIEEIGMSDLKYHLVTYYFLGHQFVSLVMLDMESLMP